jgi:hypothetical protein
MCSEDLALPVAATNPESLPCLSEITATTPRKPAVAFGGRPRRLPKRPVASRGRRHRLPKPPVAVRGRGHDPRKPSRGFSGS